MKATWYKNLFFHSHRENQDGLWYMTASQERCHFSPSQAQLEKELKYIIILSCYQLAHSMTFFSYCKISISVEFLFTSKISNSSEGTFKNSPTDLTSN